MTLPLGGPWPPPPHGIALAQMELWNAWMIGDPEGLRGAYGSVGGASAANPIAQRYFGTQNGTGGTAGLINRVARYFWSRPSMSGQRKAGLHVPLAADIATASADLLFSEPPQFVVEDGSESTQERVDELLNDGGFHAVLLEQAEIVAGLGGGFLRLVWDTDVADYVMVDAVAADSAIGEWRWGKLVAVTFFTEYTSGGPGDQEVIRHLERHEPGAIYHGLYRGDKDSLGHVENLADHPDTAAYAELVNEDAAITTGVPGLTAAYVANMRPQRRWRKVEALSQMGRSDYDGVEPLMDSLDECYTSWMRDLRLGKARIMVPESFLTSLGKGQGAAWDEDQEVYTALNMLASTQGAEQITAQQFAIRVDEHERTALALTAQILDAAGYSPSTFGLGAEGMQTATEVVSREQKSDRTRDKKTRYWSQALEPLLTTWLQLDALLFRTGASGEVEVIWPDDSQPDPEALGRTLDTLQRAAAASTDTKVRMLHPDWDEEQIATEVELIRSEQGSLVPDIGPLPTDEPLPQEVPDGRTTE